MTNQQALPVIWKFSFDVEDNFELSMPTNAQILSVQTQQEQPCIWALIPDPKAGKEQRRFRVYATGQPITEMGTFVGTFQLNGGGFVGHLFQMAQ